MLEQTRTAGRTRAYEIFYGKVMLASARSDGHKKSLPKAAGSGNRNGGPRAEMTPRRKLVLDAMAGIDGMVLAVEISRRMSVEEQLNSAQISNDLKGLVKLGMVEKCQTPDCKTAWKLVDAVEGK